MTKIGQLVAAACAALWLASPAGALTWSVDFAVFGGGGSSPFPVKGVLFFAAAADGNRNATRVDVTEVTTDPFYAGTYSIATANPSFGFAAGVVSVTAPFLAYQNPNMKSIWLSMSAPGDTELFDQNAQPQVVWRNYTWFDTPQPIFADPTPVPLPAALPLLLAAVAATAALRLRQGKAPGRERPKTPPSVDREAARHA